MWIEKMYRKFHCMNVDTGLLILRLGVGALFIFTGWMKVSNMSQTVGFFASIGFNAFWAYLVSTVELLGGIFVLLGVGVYTRVAAKLLVIVMIIAVYLLRHDMNSVMLPALTLFATLALMFTGPGKYAVMREKGPEVMM